MPQFGVRLSQELTDLDQVAAAMGLSTDAVQREMAEGYLARGLSRTVAERMVADLATAGLSAEVFSQGLGASPLKADPATPRLGGLGGLRPRNGLSGLSKGRLGGPRGLPGLGLGRAPTTTILGPPAPAEPETARVDAVAPPVDLPPPVALPASVDLPPISLPPPMSDAELMPSLKVDDPAALPPPKVLDVPSERRQTGPVSMPAPSAPRVTRPTRSNTPTPAQPRPQPPSSDPPRTLDAARARQVRAAMAASAPRLAAQSPSLAPPMPPPNSTRVPWIVAAILVVASGIFVAWAWSGRDAAVQAMRRGEAAYAKGQYPQARQAAERARALGAEIWADRMTAAATAGPHLDKAIEMLNGDDLDAAQAALSKAQSHAPDHARTLKVTLDLMRQRAAVAPKARPVMVASAAPASVAPPSIASAASAAPPSAAPAPASAASAAPPSAAPESAASVAVAPASAAPTTATVASEPPVPPEVRFARPPSRPTRDRSKVARLKIVSDMVGEIVVDGDRVSVAVPGWIEVPPGRRKIAVRGVDGVVRGLRAVKVQAGRRATVRLRAE